ncbi:MAG: chromate resistance protein [Elusimicrobia bacterium]|nr:chromate resistance protein [Elusimicrobiota bacterium]
MKSPRWLLLAHQLPDKPSNLRVKIWRKLQALGALPVKKSIYILPDTAACREDFDWLRKEIVQSGGAASVFSAASVAGRDDRQIVRSFQAARSKDYSRLAANVREFADELETVLSGGHVTGDALDKLLRRWSICRAERERLARIDFFRVPSKDAADKALKEGQRLLERVKAAAARKPPAPPPTLSTTELRGFTWVTRTSPHVDRLASAWLVRRFVDPQAKFKFVAPPYAARRKELRFDMPEAEFTHFGDWCTFETLVRRLSLAAPGVAPLAEIIHDIDLKDRKFSRPEAPGVALAVRGLCRTHRDDAPRLKAGIAFFDGLHAALAAEERR